MAESSEGSERHARMLLLGRAEQARRQGASFDGWQEHESQHLLDAVSQRDLDSIRELVWTKPLRGT